MIQPKISAVTVCYNAVNDIGKMIRIIVLILLSIFFLSSCQEKDKKVVVCWGDSLTAPHQETLKQKIKGLFVEDNDYPYITITA